MGNNYPYDIYIYDGVNNTWVNNGTIQGPKGEQGESAEITGATASIDANIGTPNVVLTVGGDALHRTFDFAFENLKGEKGEKGNRGEAATITGATATVDNSIGNPTVVVTATGTPNAQTFDFAFSGIKGEQGKKGDKGDSGVYVGSETIPVGYNVKINPAGDETDIGKYLNDGSVTRNKLANDALYSPVEYFEGERTLVVGDIGKTLASNGGGENIVTLTTDISATMPIGSEVAIFWMSGTSLKLQFTGTMRIAMAGKDVLSNRSLMLSKMYTLVALKKITTDMTNGDIWTVQGDAEVVA